MAVNLQREPRFEWRWGNPGPGLNDLRSVFLHLKAMPFHFSLGLISEVALTATKQGWDSWIDFQCWHSRPGPVWFINRSYIISRSLMKQRQESLSYKSVGFFPCVVGLRTVWEGEGVWGGRRVRRSRKAVTFLFPILYLAISKCHHTEKILVNWQYDSFLYKTQSRLRMQFAVLITSKSYAVLCFPSTSSYLLVMDFCKPNCILPGRIILTVCLQHPLQKGLIIIDRDDRETDSSCPGQLNNLLSQFTSCRYIVEPASSICV